MAQGQNLDVNIMAQVKGMESIATMINRVGALEREIKSLSVANAGLATSTQRVTQAGRTYNNAVDAQSKALRQNRQGTQMAMMQVNDFVTSVSTGASPVMAFNQQIGQLGYSMSLMGGKAGGVGRFLAGPWGLAIIGASTLIGLLSKDSEDAGGSFERMAGYFVGGVSQITSSIRQELAPEIEALAPLFTWLGGILSRVAQFTGQLLEDMLNGLIAKGVGAVKIAAALFRGLGASLAEGVIGGFNVIIDAWNGFLVMLESGFDSAYAQTRSFVALFGVELPAAAANLSRLKIDKIANQWSGSFANMAGEIGTAVVGMRDFRNRFVDFQNITPTSFGAPEKSGGRGGASSPAKAASEAAKKQNEHNKALEEYLSLLGNINGKELPEWQRQIAELTEKFEALGSEDRAKWADSFSEAIRTITYDPEKFLELVEQISGKALPDWQSQISELSKRFEAMSIEGEVENLQAYYNAVDALASGPLDALQSKYDDLLSTTSPLENDLAEIESVFRQQKTLYEQLGVPMDELIDRYERLKAAALSLPIKEANDTLIESFRSVGQSVSDAFQGMLTGAMGWKDGMRSIITSVISELWRLYVVQQIVGFVSKALGGIGLPTPTAIPGRAVGGSVSANTPYMVGEKGPELMIPGGSGTIIPRHNLDNLKGGGGGAVINVDARGATDPEAVRRQVQAGIIEAAPHIIKASSESTIRAMRRPRLAGGTI